METTNNDNIIIKEHNNKDFLNNILRLKLGEHITKFKNEKYFVILKDSILLGISRIVELSNIELSNKKFDFFNISNENKIFFLSGIWIDESIRNKGYGQKLINERMALINFKDIVISDVMKSSKLLLYYQKELNMKIIKENDSYYYLKRN
jgi:ribosomal protein S18 acetylase RimI-like enzyme